MSVNPKYRDLVTKLEKSGDEESAQMVKELMFTTNELNIILGSFPTSLSDYFMGDDAAWSTVAKVLGYDDEE